jgi:hypothetical protein
MNSTHTTISCFIRNKIQTRWCAAAKDFEGLLHLLLVPHPQEIGEEQTPKGFPGRLHLIPKQHCVLTQLPLFDGEQQRHPLHVRNGSPFGIIASAASTRIGTSWSAPAPNPFLLPTSTHCLLIIQVPGAT